MILGRSIVTVLAVVVWGTPSKSSPIEAAAAQSICRRGVYGDFVVLLEHYAPAQVFCAKNFPIVCANTKRDVKPPDELNSKNSKLPTTTTSEQRKAEAAKALRLKQSAWEKCLRNRKKMMAQICSCIQKPYCPKPTTSSSKISSATPTTEPTTQPVTVTSSASTTTPTTSVDSTSSSSLDPTSTETTDSTIITTTAITSSTDISTATSDIDTVTISSSTFTTTTSDPTATGACATQQGIFIMQASGTGDFAVDGNFAILQAAFGSGYRSLFAGNRQAAQQFRLMADCSLKTSDGNLLAMIGGSATLHNVYFFPSVAAASALVNVSWQALVCQMNADNTLTCTAMGQSTLQVTPGDKVFQIGDQNYGEQLTVNLVPVPGG